MNGEAATKPAAIPQGFADFGPGFWTDDHTDIGNPGLNEILNDIIQGRFIRNRDELLRPRKGERTEAYPPAHLLDQTFHQSLPSPSGSTAGMSSRY